MGKNWGPKLNTDLCAWNRIIKLIPVTNFMVLGAKLKIREVRFKKTS